jgi:hypothetical protein
MLTSWCSWKRRAFSRHIINAPKDFPTIHATVDAAPSGATIHIAGSRDRHRHQVAVAMADIVEFTRLT